MPRHATNEAWEDDDDAWDDGDEGLEDVQDLGVEDETPTVPCPYCKRQVPEDVPRCPYCEKYITSEDAAPPPRKPWWIIIGALLVLYIVYRWIKL